MSDNSEPIAPAVLATADGRRLTLTLNRPEDRNVLSAEIIDGLRTGLATATDDDVRVVVLTNVGSVFCAGADLKSPAPTLDDGNEPDANPFVDLLEAIRACPKPVVARIDGHVTGGGVGLAAVCDLSVMSEDAKIGFTEVRIGVAPAMISVVCLPKMRPADAAELMLGGERVSASRAAEVGLINYAEPQEQLDHRVDQLCDSLTKGGPNAVAATKQILQLVPTLTTDVAFTSMAQLSRQLFGTEEATEGIAAFRQRRLPSWTDVD